MEKLKHFGTIPENPFKEKVQVSAYLLEWFDNILDSQAEHIQKLEEENEVLRQRINKIKSI